MRIAVISSREYSGGAGVATGRICQGLSSVGHEVHRLVEVKDCTNPSGIKYTARGIVGGKVEAMGRICGIKYSTTSERKRCARNIRRIISEIKPDVINIHGFNEWSEPGIPRRLAAELTEIAPVMWTLHDMWPLNGMVDYCGEGLGTQMPEEDNRERDALMKAGGKLVMASPSKWLAGIARKHFENRIPMHQLPNGVNTRIFKPMDKAVARDMLGIPAQSPCLLAVADRLDASRKGMDILVAALSYLPGNITLGLVGDAFPPAVDDRIIMLGRINDERLLRAAYSSADVVVVPSRLDNLPNIMIESLACGTPLAGFHVGGLPDAIRPDCTGALAEPYDPKSLADAIRHVLRHGEAMRGMCRKIAETEYSLDAVAKRYTEVLQSLVSSPLIGR